MALLLLLLLDSSSVTAARTALDALHGYDILSVEVDATPAADGLRVDCRLRVKALRAGALTFVFSRAAEGLSVTLGDAPVPFGIGGDELDGILPLLGVPEGAIPRLLTLRPEGLAAGEEATFRLRYAWRPPPGSWFRATERDVDTHLSGFWLPAMADELFAVTLRVRTDLAAFGPGRARRTADGWLFESEAEQVVALVVADLARVDGEGCEVWLPAERRDDGDAIARDLSEVLRTLEGWFGPAGEGPFRLVLAPPGPVPSYCAGSFAVVREGPRDRPRWLAHLAHESAHRWFGHRLRTPVVGRGGTWLREGLAEWAGIEAAGAVLGGDAARGLWRDRFTRYISRIDLRAGEGGILFANEPTLLDATYVDDPRVAYSRGSLVLRLLAHEAGPEKFRERLRDLMRGGPGGLVTSKEFLAAAGGAETAAYYAATSRLPDLRLEGGRVLCDDPLWPGGRVPVRIGDRMVEIEVRGGSAALPPGDGPVELDPERLYLDPVLSNNGR